MAQLELAEGIKITTFEPPPTGFDPLTASAALLQKHGFPPRLPEPHHQERYRKVWSQLKSRFHYIQPTFRVNSERRHGPRKRLATEGPETAFNWSGGVVYAPAGTSFRWVQGDWVVPDVHAPTHDQLYTCASWIGIDGDGGSDDVCQAGFECDVFRSRGSISRNIYAWHVWYPAPEVQITNLPVNAGDMVTMLLCTPQDGGTGGGAGSTTATVYITDYTTGASMSYIFSAPDIALKDGRREITKLVGNCAEWIVEAPLVNHAQSLIGDYGQVFFNVCEAFLTSGAAVNGGTGDNINLIAGGTVVSQGILVSPTVIECSYSGPK